MRARMMAGIVAGLLLAMSGCSRNRDPQVRDASQPSPSPSPPRSAGCADVPTAADLAKLLKAAPAQNGDAGGLNHGKAMWGAIVDRTGRLCALAASTDDKPATWPGSRAIAIAKASTSNAFSSDVAPMSTARLYTLSFGRVPVRTKVIRRPISDYPLTVPQVSLLLVCSLASAVTDGHTIIRVQLGV